MINRLARACKNLSDHPRIVGTNASAIANARIKWPASIKNVAIHASMHAESMPFAMLLATRRCARVHPVIPVIRSRSALPNNVRELMNHDIINFFNYNI